MKYILNGNNSEEMTIFGRSDKNLEGMTIFGRNDKNPDGMTVIWKE